MTGVFLFVTTTLLKWNALLALLGGAFFAMSKLKRVHVFSFTARQSVVRVLLLTIIVAPPVATVASSLIEPANIFQPALQIAADVRPDHVDRMSRVPTMTFTSTTAASVEKQTGFVLVMTAILWLLSTVTALVRMSRLLKDRRRLHAVMSESFVLRALGKVKVQVSARVSTPFATRIKGEALVVVPEALLVEPERLALSIRHELQHHRQRDLQWNWLLEVARFIAGWNPLAHIGFERIEELDELACDENLLGRGRIDVKRYANCLFEAALAIQTTGGGVKLAGTARMATTPSFLRRRIQMTLQPQSSTRPWLIKFTAAIGVMIVAASVWASEGLVKDRRLTEAQVERLARTSQLKSGIPIVVNKDVLNYLNRATGTPRARFYMRNALKRMRAYRPMLERKMNQAGLPLDLLALPAMESGYQNTETITSAGIWQFIPDTARRYGLQVDDQVDERINPERETDAAIAYLSHLQSMFQKDWPLTLLSYNAGEHNVQSLVAQTGEHDVFKMIDEGKITNEENANYVPKFMATLIVVDNPNLVDE